MKTVDHSYEQALIMHDTVHIHVIMNIIVTPLSGTPGAKKSGVPPTPSNRFLWPIRCIRYTRCKKVRYIRSTAQGSSLVFNALSYHQVNQPKHLPNTKCVKRSRYQGDSGSQGLSSVPMVLPCMMYIRCTMMPHCDFSIVHTNLLPLCR